MYIDTAMSTFFSAFAKTLGILLGFLAAIVMLAVLLGFLNNLEFSAVYKYEIIKGDEKSENKIVYLNINGPIFSQSNQNISLINPNVIYVDMIEEELINLSNQENIRALLISLNSPGGTVSGSNRLYEILLNFKEEYKIPIYIHVEELLASGAMWAALPANKIYASYGAIIGNIGVKGPAWFVYNNPKSIKNNFFGPEISTFNGIDFYQPYAGRSKDIFNPFRQPTEEEINNIQEMLNSIYDKFILYVSKHRKIESDYIRNDIGALLYDSQSAKSHNLIDGIFSFEETVEELTKNLKIKTDYKILEIKNTNKNFIQHFSSILIDKDIYFNKQIENDICNLENQQLLLMTKFNFSSCKN